VVRTIQNSKPNIDDHDADTVEKGSKMQIMMITPIVSEIWKLILMVKWMHSIDPEVT